MTLDEAIRHAEEVADKKEREKQNWEEWLKTDSDYRAVTEKVSCELCAEEHHQLAEWLKDYKRLKEQKPCEDCISRKAAIEAFKSSKHADTSTWTTYCIVGVLEDLPSVNPQLKTGHWIEYDHGLNVKYYQCSICLGFDGDEKGKYCKWCGTKMVEPQERSDKE